MSRVVLGALISPLLALNVCAALGRLAQITYENPARTLRATIGASPHVTGVFWKLAPIFSVNPLPSEKGSKLTSDAVAQRVVDCTDRRYRCIRWGLVLAVPRSGLRPKDTYSVHGVSFKVERCLRGNSSSCQVALLSATCGRYLNMRTGLCGARPRVNGGRKWFSYVVYFIYNEDYGITAMGTTDHLQRTAAAKMQVATQLILISNAGLLAPLSR